MGCTICGASKIAGRGLCKSHYYKARRRGELDQYETKVEAGTSKQDLGMRLMSKVAKSKDGCWVWTGATAGIGYGQIQMWPGVKRAHRVSYEHFVGPIPKGRLLRHTCDNKLCINPDHLIPGTKADNGRDSVERGQFRPNNKLTPEQVTAIRADHRAASTIAKEYGVVPSTITRIKDRTRWATLWRVD
ncbi:HNH endonuclease [Bradyrhizobium sp. USDA 4452]